MTILGKPASELGLLTPDELLMRPGSAVSDEVGRVLEMIGSDDQGGLRRSTFLRGLLAAGALPALTPLLSFGDGSPATEHRVASADTFVAITGCHRQLYWTSPPRLLFEAAYAHTQLGIDLLRGAVGSTRAAVSSALAESALLTARLALFDLRRPAVAERCFDVALAATREADDHALAATVLGHMAFVPIFGARPRDADGAIRAALQHAWHGVSPVVRSWLHCVASEAESRAGGQVSARHEIDLAAKALDTDGAEMVPDWCDFYNSTRFESLAGYASNAAGDNADAAVHLQRALDGLGEADGKQRSVVLADLAQAQATDAEKATDLLIQATDTLASDWYRTGFDRVLAVRPLLGGSAATILDERIEVLARANLSASSSF